MRPRKDRLTATVSLRAEGAAISRYNVRLRGQYQEIAASGFALLAMTPDWLHDSAPYTWAMPLLSLSIPPVQHVGEISGG